MTKYKTLLEGVSKFFIYSSFFLLLNAIIYFDYLILKNNLGEVSATEFFELFFLCFIVYSFWKTGKKNVELKSTTLLISGFFLVMIIRELDFLFDMIIHGIWKVPALIVTAFACGYAFKHKYKTISGLSLFIKEKTFNIVLLGMAMLLVFSRIYGMGDFWKAVMEEAYIRDVKNISEEGIELVSYFIIAFGAYFSNKQIQKNNEILRDDSFSI